MARDYKTRKKKMERRKHRKHSLSQRINAKGNKKSKNIVSMILEEIDNMTKACTNSKKEVDDIVAIHPEDITTKMQVSAGITHIEGKLSKIRQEVEDMKDAVGTNDLNAIDSFLKICSDIETILNEDIANISTIIRHLKQGDHIQLQFVDPTAETTVEPEVRMDEPTSTSEEVYGSSDSFGITDYE